MAGYPSRDSTVEASAAGVTYTAVGLTRDNIDFKHAGTAIDTTTRDDGISSTSIPGRGKVTMSFGGNYSESDAGQAILKNAAFTRTQVYLRFRPRGAGTGRKGLYGLFTPTDFSDASPNDGVLGFTFSAELSGALSEETQT